MKTKVEEALMARCEAAFVAIETAANAIQYDYRGGHGAELLLPLRDARTIIAELSERIAQQDATIARMREALAKLAAYPIEEFAFDTKPDTHTLFGANEWRLTVGHIRKARAALNQGEVK